MKLALMRKNPSVCFEVDDMQNMANWKSVIVQGKFEELEDPQLRKHALDVLNRPRASIGQQHHAHIFPLLALPARRLQRDQRHRVPDSCDRKIREI